MIIELLNDTLKGGFIKLTSVLPFALLAFNTLNPVTALLVTGFVFMLVQIAIEETECPHCCHKVFPNPKHRDMGTRKN